MDDKLYNYLQRELAAARFAIDLADRFRKTAVEDNNYSMAVYWDAEGQKAKAKMNMILDIANIYKIEIE